MYTCIVYFNEVNKNELLRLLKLIPARNKDFEGDCVYLTTRKLWKFFWFNKRLKKFPREFFYSRIYNPFRYITIPDYIRNKYNYDFIITEAYSHLLRIHFTDIKDVWEIKLFMFLK